MSISQISRTAAVAANPPNSAREATETSSATFQITSTELHVPVVTLSTQDHIKLLENIKQDSKVQWNKYRSEITTLPKNNNLDFMIDLTYRNTNRLSIPSLKLAIMTLQKILLVSIKCHLLESKILMLLHSNKPLLDQPIKKTRNIWKTCWNIKKRWLYKRKILIYTIQSITNFIGIGLSRQTNTSISQKINFTEKLEENDNATMIFFAEKQQKTILNFSLDALNITE